MDLNLLVHELTADGVGEGVDVGVGLIVRHVQDVLRVLEEVDLRGSLVGTGFAFHEDGLDTIHRILRGGSLVAGLQVGPGDLGVLALRDHGELDVLLDLRQDVLLDDVPDERLLGLALSLLVQVHQPAAQEIGRLDGLVDLVPAVLNPDRGELQAALGRPLGGELLGHLGVDGVGRDEVRVGVDAGEELRVGEALVDALQEDLQADLRRHRDVELLVQLGYIDILGGEPDAEGIA